MKRLIEDIKKYYKYAIYSGRSELKTEIANSHLSWLWWILDPLLFMLVYTFVALVVFGKGEKYFPIYVFIGLSAWKFFEKTVKQSVTLVSGNRGIVLKVYLPKYQLILVKMYANGFKMMVSFALVAVMLLIYRVPLSYRVIYFIPLLVVLALFTFGASCILLHFGVFVEDLSNVINVLLKLVFYLTGIFYSLAKRVPAPYNMVLLKCNPIAFIIDEMRKCILYETTPDFMILGIWFVISLILSAIGIKLIYKYENSYVKII